MNRLPATLESLHEDFNLHSGASTGFGSKVSLGPYPLAQKDFNDAKLRYRTIKSFQEKAMALFRASLRGDAHPKIAEGVLGDVTAGIAEEYHRSLDDAIWQTPVFFRTDEARPGKLTEIQCSGSGWDIHQGIYDLYANNPDDYGPPEYFKQSLAESYATSLKKFLGQDPVVHHLVDNASRPHGARYFIQKARQQGVKYFGYDEGVSAGNCNFVRSHDFYSVIFHNFFKDRQERSVAGEIKFDLPPVALFDTKFILSWPFWSHTRSHFTDEERELFPHTAVVEPDGIETESGERMTIDDFCGLTAGRRDFFLKYGGTDIAINWGSRGVFSTKSLSRRRCAEAMAMAVNDYQNGRPWILQKAIFVKEPVDMGNNSEGTEQANGKWSHFYGPDGLMGLLVMHLNNHKVHGQSDTVMSIAY